MAVFTTVTIDDAQALLENYNLGELINLRGITAGIENTNYFLDTSKGSYVLTLFEVLTFEQLPFYIELMHHLASKGVPVPEPQTLKDGTRITKLHNKPATIVSKLKGGYEPQPSSKHCNLAGATLAKAHLAALDFSIQQPNLRGYDWWLLTAPKVTEFLESDQTDLLKKTLAEQTEFNINKKFVGLPFGPAHCDLFRDNVLFAGTFESPQMGGFIDFYFAGCDYWLFDVAVSVNDWCINRESGAFIKTRLNAWLNAYNKIRPFTDQERELWPIMLRAAAFRFWLSRLYDFYIPRPAQTLKPHDPRHFERILKLRSDKNIPPLP